MHSVKHDLTLADYRALKAYLGAHPDLRPKSWSWAYVLVITGSGVLMAALFRGSGLPYLSGVFVASLALMIYFQKLQDRALKLFAPRPNGVFLCEHLVALTEEGIRSTTPTSSGEIKWPAVMAVDETARHIFIRLDTTSAYVIPRTAFQTSESLREFVDYARSKVPAQSPPNVIAF